MGNYVSRRLYVSSCATLVQCVFKQRHRNLHVKNYTLPLLYSKRSGRKEPTKPSKAPFCRFCRFIFAQSGRQIAGLWVDVVADNWSAAGFFGAHGEPMRVHQRTKAPFHLRLIFQLRPPLSVDISHCEPAFQFRIFNAFPNQFCRIDWSGLGCGVNPACVSFEVVRPTNCHRDRFRRHASRATGRKMQDERYPRH